MTAPAGGVAAPIQPIAPTRARYRTNRCHKNVKWQKDEDDLLIQVMSQEKRPSYAFLGQAFPGKTGRRSLSGGTKC
jgi:hypothetical protein